jgi:hypothetical protein
MMALTDVKNVRTKKSLGIRKMGQYIIDQLQVSLPSGQGIRDDFDPKFAGHAISSGDLGVI